MGVAGERREGKGKTREIKREKRAHLGIQRIAKEKKNRRARERKKKKSNASQMN